MKNKKSISLGNINGILHIEEDEEEFK